MVTASDLICLPYTPDLTEAGISYACRSLPHTYDRMDGSLLDRLRRIGAGISVELAFRRHLTQQGVPFDVKGAPPFTEPDRYDVSLGGHGCDIKSFLISHRAQIASIHSHPEQILKAPALVPLDQHISDSRPSADLYLFCFLTGLVASSTGDIEKARAAGQPAQWTHPMSNAWVRPRVWCALGPLALKSESEEPVLLELGGQNEARNFITQAVELAPKTRVVVEGDFFSLAYIHMNSRPAARLGIHSPARRETYLVRPEEWGNIWVYGMHIYLAGWISREEFRRRADLVPEGSRVFQYDRTRTKNLAVPVEDLRPLPELLSRAHAWAQSRGSAGA